MKTKLNSSINESRLQAEAFSALCHSRQLVLPNAWDGASAAVVVRAGAQAVATTSAGVAWVAGTADGGGLDQDAAILAIQSIVRATKTPVSADIEHGYGESPAQLARTIERVLSAGAVGINIEDSFEGILRDSDAQCGRLEIIRSTADRLGVPLFVNARVDTFFYGSTDQDERLENTLQRASAYVRAGADGIFVPGVADEPTISLLVAGISVPLNVMVGPGSLTADTLLALGVGRVTLGMAGALGAYGALERAAKELLTTGSYDTLAGSPDFGSFNEMMTR